MLADLEQKWGMTLLERSKSGVCLTSAGEPVRPFLLLEHSGKAEVSDLLERAHVQSDIHFTAWEDFAITAMVERSLGRKHPARPDLAAHPVQNRNPLLQQPYYHPIGLAMKKQAHPTPAVQKFIEYLPSQEVAK